MRALWEKSCVLAAHFDRLFKERHNFFEVVGRTCLCPRHIAGVDMLGHLADKFGWDARRVGIVFGSDADDGAVDAVRVPLLGLLLEFFEQVADLGVGHLFVGELGHQRHLTATSFTATDRHHTRLVPVEQ